MDPTTPAPDSPLTYDALVTELFPRLSGGIRWGLDRTRRLLEHVGDPHLQFRVLHVGGTNGKGSVAAHLESILRRQGHRVGLYSSPHLCTFRERVRIDGEAIGVRALLDAADRLWPRILEEQASFFEATTAISFLALANAGVEIAVIEVGLGGRLDSTNVVSPEAVILTNVSLDHVQLLGSTLHDVALEKAGIIKPGVPVITTEASAPAIDVFRTAAAAAGAPLHQVSGPAASASPAAAIGGDAAAAEAARVTDVAVSLDGTAFTLRGSGWGDLPLRTPLTGLHQAMNAALAVRALDVLAAGGAAGARPAAETVREGVAAVRWPGRFQVERLAGVTWLLDVAHNVAGVEALVDAVRAVALPGPVVALVGVLGDKDWRGMLTPLHALAGRVILTSPPTAPVGRRWDPREALAEAPSERAVIVEDFVAALERAYAEAVRSGGCVLVTGSFHTVGDALGALGLCRHGHDARIGTPSFMR